MSLCNYNFTRSKISEHCTTLVMTLRNKLTNKLVAEYFVFCLSRKNIHLILTSTYRFWWFCFCQFLYLRYFGASLQVFQFNHLLQFHLGSSRLIDLTIAFCCFSVTEEQRLNTRKKEYIVSGFNTDELQILGCGHRNMSKRKAALTSSIRLCLFAHLCRIKTI